MIPEQPIIGSTGTMAVNLLFKYSEGQIYEYPRSSHSKIKRQVYRDP